MDNLTLVQTKQTDWTVERTSLKIHIQSVSASVSVSFRCVSAGLRNPLKPCSWAARKWKDNEEMKRKWRLNEEIKRKWKDNEEMERDSLSTFPHSLFIFSLSIHFLNQNLSYFVAKC